MNPTTIPVETGQQARPSDLRGLFHQLGNQLGVILAHAELMEIKAADQAQRDRATHVVNAALEAMTLTRSIRDLAVE
ncbi:MAG TPA: hypothetical protein VMW48_08560 [Vicinamibacterales bacterium]|nr:hypothetical protein [Vicinamibacterales bacterium]